MGIIIRQSVKGTVVSYVGIAIGFFTTFFVLTNFLTAEEIGLTRVLVDAATVFAGLAQLGTTSSAVRYYPYFKEGEKDHGFFFWTLVIPFIGFLIYGIVFWLLKEPISGFFAENSPLFVDYYNFIFPVGFFLLYMSVFEVNSNLLLRIVVPKFIREVVVRLLSLAAYLLYAFDLINLDGFIIAFSSVYGIATILNIVYIFSLKKISLKPDFKFLKKSLVKDYLLYTLFLIAAALGGVIAPSINSFFISAKMGLNFAGIFAIAGYMASMIEMPYRSLGTISGPHISQAIKDQDFTKINALCKSISLHQLLGGFFIFLAIWINIDLIFELLPNGEIYAAGKWVVFILGLSRLLNSVFNVSEIVLRYSKFYYVSLILTVILTTSAIILNNSLIPVWGMNGAAIASLLSYLIFYFLLLSLVRWKIKTSIFSWKQAQVVLLVLLLFLCDRLWTSFLTPLFLKLPLKVIYAQVIDAIVKSSTLLGSGILLTYLWRISEDANALIRNILNRFRLRK